MKGYIYICDVFREVEVPADLLRSPEALFEAVRGEAEWCVSGIKSARLERAYVTKEGAVVEYLVEYDYGTALARVILAEDPVKALEEAESAVATVEAL